MKTGRENYSAPYPKLPYLSCGCSNKNKYVYNTDIEKNIWTIHHNLKGRPIIITDLLICLISDTNTHKFGSIN